MGDELQEENVRSQLALQGIQQNQCQILRQKWSQQNEIKQNIRIQDDFRRLRKLEIIDKRKSSSVPNLNLKKSTLLNKRSLYQTQTNIQDDSTQSSKYYENDNSFK